ncbi:chemotaxis protein CheX [Methylomonas sp. AM2-LC]|uniref:chemotaxis protein CheX n=1 Tax=Methylomonas sp. AM2-LC TaxID=3153301 RepID=UPI00326307BD
MDQNPIAAKITNSWEVLAGYALIFIEDICPCKPDLLALHFMVPINIVDETREATTVLEISETHAKYLTSSMFAISENDVKNDDVIDACGELCNVFSANVRSAIISTSNIDLGVPKNLKPAEFQSIIDASHLDLCFKGQTNEGSVIVYLFNAYRNK